MAPIPIRCIESSIHMCSIGISLPAIAVVEPNFWRKAWQKHGTRIALGNYPQRCQLYKDQYGDKTGVEDGWVLKGGGDPCYFSYMTTGLGLSYSANHTFLPATVKYCMRHGRHNAMDSARSMRVLLVFVEYLCLAHRTVMRLLVVHGSCGLWTFLLANALVRSP